MHATARSSFYYCLALLCCCFCCTVCDGLSLARRSFSIKSPSTSTCCFRHVGHVVGVLEAFTSSNERSAWFKIRGGGRDGDDQDATTTTLSAVTSFDELDDDNDSDESSSATSDESSYIITNRNEKIAKNSLDDEIPRSDEIWDPSDKEQVDARIDKQMNSRQVQKGAYIRAAVLCASLACDITLNKRKRARIFIKPTSERIFSGLLGSINVNAIVPTTVIATGFALAASVFFNLSNIIQNDFLSDQLSSESAKRSSLFLFVFSFVNLMTYFTTGTPFMGMGGLAIHLHNALVGLNGWFKGVASTNTNAVKDTTTAVVDATLTVPTLLLELLQGCKNTLLNLYPKKLTVVASWVFSVAALGALGRSLATCRHLVLGGNKNGGSMLTYAFLAKHILDFGVYATLKEMAEKEEENIPGDWQSIILNGAVSICAAVEFVSMIVATFLLNLKHGANFYVHTMNDFTFLLLAIFSGFQSTKGLLMKMKETSDLKTTN